MLRLVAEDMVRLLSILLLLLIILITYNSDTDIWKDAQVFSCIWGSWIQTYYR